MEIRIRKRNQNKFRKMLKKYRQYIIVGVTAVVIIIICIVVLITSGAKYKKNNSLLIMHRVIKLRIMITWM